MFRCSMHIHLLDSPTSLGQLKSFRFNEGIAGDELWPDAWRNIEAKAPYADIKILPKELWKIGYKARISLSKTVGSGWYSDGKWDLDILTFSSAQVHSQWLSTFSFFFTIFGNGAWKSQNVTTFFICIYTSGLQRVHDVKISSNEWQWKVRATTNITAGSKFLATMMALAVMKVPVFDTEHRPSTCWVENNVLTVIHSSSFAAG